MRGAAIGRISLALPKVPDLGASGVFYKGKLFAAGLSQALTAGKYFIATIGQKRSPGPAVARPPVSIA
jgi:hypothetical protein